MPISSLLCPAASLPFHLPFVSSLQNGKTKEEWRRIRGEIFFLSLPFLACQDFGMTTRRTDEEKLRLSFLAFLPSSPSLSHLEEEWRSEFFFFPLFLSFLFFRMEK